MDIKAVLISSLVLTLISRSSALNARPCAANKAAAEGLSLDQRGAQGQDRGCRPPSVKPVTGDAKPQPSPFGERSDAVYGPKETDRPRHRPYSTYYGFDDFLPWFPLEIFPKWPQRPARPQNPFGYIPKWFFGWFTQGTHRPPKPMKPPSNKPGDNNIKPVYEYIDEDRPDEWKPGALVGGPNNDIVGVTQDLSSWSRPPTPKPTRPTIPGYPDTSTKRGSSVVESIFDLIFK